MASKLAHQSTGWAAGVIAAAVVASTLPNDPYHLWAALTFLMGYSGGTAPDWLEISWWRTGLGRHSWIAHRTWTHWGIAWIALLALSYVGIQQYAWSALLFGFAAGGVMHLLADWPNPMGVPWLLVSHRHSLKWWKSGRCDWLVTIAAWTGAVVMADKTWLHGVFRHQTLHFVKFGIPPGMLNWMTSV